MTRPALCLLGPADGRVIVGPERVHVTTSAAVTASLIPDDDAGSQDVRTVIYMKHTFAAGDREFDFYIPTDRSLGDAFAALYDGYKPKETR